MDACGTIDASDSLLTPDEAAGRLRVSAETLATWRCTRRQHIPFVKVGSLVQSGNKPMQLMILQEAGGLGSPGVAKLRDTIHAMYGLAGQQ